MVQNRWASKVLWMSISSLVALLLTQYGLWGYLGMDEGVFTQIVEMVLGILGLLGIVNNPTDPVEW